MRLPALRDRRRSIQTQCAAYVQSVTRRSVCENNLDGVYFTSIGCAHRPARCGTRTIVRRVQPNRAFSRDSHQSQSWATEGAQQSELCSMTGNASARATASSAHRCARAHSAHVVHDSRALAPVSHARERSRQRGVSESPGRAWPGASST
jgi:hypothetical protein